MGPYPMQLVVVTAVRKCTIRGIISRWAPSNENNTRAYIENVSRLAGIAPDEPIGIRRTSPRAGWQ